MAEPRAQGHCELLEVEWKDGKIEKWVERNDGNHPCVIDYEIWDDRVKYWCRDSPHCADGGAGTCIKPPKEDPTQVYCICREGRDLDPANLRGVIGADGGISDDRDGGAGDGGA